MTQLRPQPGPQQAFAACRADIAIFGGAAGGGKSWSLVAEGARVGARGGNGVIFRRQAVELTGSGSIWDESAVYAQIGGVSRQSPQLSWTFPEAGGFVEFRHLQLDKDKHAHMGKQYDFIGFDELTHFEESQFWYLYSRARSVSGRFRPYVRATCNPDPDSFVRKLIDWWIGEDGYAIPDRGGVLRWFVRQSGELVWCDEGTPRAQSLTFIPSMLEDNAILRARDPDYENKLEALIDVDRDRLRRGNWNARDTSNLIYAYDPRVNDCELPEDYDRERWVHSLSVDFGVENDCSWTMMAAHPHRKKSYMIFSFKRRMLTPEDAERFRYVEESDVGRKDGLLPEDASKVTKSLQEEYRPDCSTGDAGGLGKPYVVAHNRRYPESLLEAADKTEKLAHIKMFNGDLKSGDVMIVKAHCEDWISEAQSHRWADEFKLKEKKGSPNHCLDGGLYSHRKLNAYLNEVPAPPKPPRRRADDPDLIAEEEQALQAELNRPWWDR